MLRQRSEGCIIIVIKRKNFASIMDFSVATMIEKLLNHNGAILLFYCDNDQAMAIEFCLNNQMYVATIKATE